MSTNYQWEDYGKTAQEWNKKFPRTMMDLYSEEGFGLYLESPPGSHERHFIPAIPVLQLPITVTKGMSYPKGVEEVFDIDFVVPNGTKLSSPRLSIYRTGNFLKAVPIVCGVSPTQVRTALNMVAEYLSSQ